MTDYVYMRISTDDQNFDSQRDELINAGYDFPDDRIFSDIVSGLTKGKERVGWAALNDVLADGDVVYCYRLDRFGRNTVDILQRCEDLVARGVSVNFIKNGILMDKNRKADLKLQLTIIAAFAEWEWALRSERVQDGIKARKKRGLPTGRVPFSKAVRNDCYSLYVAGHSANEIRRLLKEKHGLPKMPGRQTVYDIIKEYNLSDDLRGEVKEAQKARRSGSLILDGNGALSEEEIEFMRKRKEAQEA